MDICLALLLIIYVITTILDIRVSKKQQELIEDVLERNFRLISEKSKVLSALAKVKIDETTSIEVLEEIEKILKGEE